MVRLVSNVLYPPFRKVLFGPLLLYGPSEVFRGSWVGLYCILKMAGRDMATMVRMLQSLHNCWGPFMVSICNLILNQFICFLFSHKLTTTFFYVCKQWKEGL